MPRRNRILLEQIERNIRAFEADGNEDYLMVAYTIGVNRSTARSIVARYFHGEGRIAERPRGGAINVRFHNEMKDCLNDILNDNFMLTLAQINQQLRRRLPRIHDRTVATTLDGKLFRYKIARRQPAKRSRPEVRQKSHDYANWFMGQAIVSHPVFVDECGYNI